MDHIKDILKGLHEEFGWFIWGLAGLGVIWFFNGGPDRPVAHEGAYLKPLAPVDTGEAYGTYYAGTPISKKETLNLPEAPADIVRKAESTLASFVTRSKEAVAIHANSLLAKGIYLDGPGGAKASNPDAEYLRIVASPSASGPIRISGLVLAGISLPEGIFIPRAVFLPLTGQPLEKQNVSLQPGGRAIITSGASPFGASFQVNSCTGYLNELGTFTPALRKECPDGSNCRTDKAKGFTYNMCVGAHLNDKGFYSGEWRLFLDQPKEIWRNSSEIIRLIDAKGNIVDAITY
ncbi:hypothetical protein KW799_01795 [Candidatus Parcubacteria bacterium]|nr:hypothetical protein [Candidatus Parcubacteria bacterium]